MGIFPFKPFALMIFISFVGISIICAYILHFCVAFIKKLDVGFKLGTEKYCVSTSEPTPLRQLIKTLITILQTAGKRLLLMNMHPRCRISRSLHYNSTCQDHYTQHPSVFLLSFLHTLLLFIRKWCQEKNHQMCLQ